MGALVCRGGLCGVLRAAGGGFLAALNGVAAAHTETQTNIRPAQSVQTREPSVQTREPSVQTREQSVQTREQSVQTREPSVQTREPNS